MALKPPTGPNTPINSGIAEEGTALPWRNQVNFIGDAVSATDDSANNRTKVTIRGAPVFNVKDYGALGDGTTDDTAAIQAAIAACVAAGGGVVFFPPGTYSIGSTLTIYGSIIYRGSGRAATTLKLAASANTDLFKTLSFATLTGGVTRNGPQKWAIEDMTLDGNKANNSSGYCLRAYADAYRISGVTFQNGASGNVYSESGTGGSDMEAHWRDFKLYDPANSTINLEWKGPNDSQFVNGVVARTGATSGGTGIKTLGNATFDQFTQVHVYGGHTNGFHFQKTGLCANCVSEGATGINLLLESGGCAFTGSVFGANAASEIGIQIGDSSGAAHSRIDAYVWNFGAGGNALKFVTNSGYHQITLRHDYNSDTVVYSGTPATTDELRIVSTLSGKSETRIYGETYYRKGVRIDREDATNALVFGSANDTILYRSAASLLTTDGHFVFSTAGKGIRFKEGSNAMMGTAVLVGGTVVVSTTAVAAGDRIFITAVNTGGTAGFLSYTISAGTSFTVTSTSGTDTRTFNWLIVRPS